ncbi:MAG: hypothetical protein AAGI88_17190 [Pseudomonadota bacterium]
MASGNPLFAAVRAALVATLLSIALSIATMSVVLAQQAPETGSLVVTP